MIEPTVSVMMPAYNAAAFIVQAIESVLAQTFSDWELLIVDDGSSDETYDVSARFDDQRIRIVRQANGGESVARNTALRHMRGRLVAFLDADDLFLPDHLALTTRFLHDNPRCHAVYTDGYYCDRQGQRLHPLSEDRRGPFTGDIFEQVVRASDVFGPPTCVVLRREVIDRHDLAFDPQIVIGPDWDFLTRYSEWAQFGHVDARTCLYRVHETNVTLRVDRQRRALYLARCREKAIQLERFGDCSLTTRREVFYDLLVEQLTGHPRRQAELISAPQFKALPAEIQAQLLRLMATEALLYDAQGAGQEAADAATRRADLALFEQASAWLRQAQRLHPGDWRSRLLMLSQQVSPTLTQRLLRIWRRNPATPASTSPFAGLR